MCVCLLFKYYYEQSRVLHKLIIFKLFIQLAVICIHFLPTMQMIIGALQVSGRNIKFNWYFCTLFFLKTLTNVYDFPRSHNCLGQISFAKMLETLEYKLATNYQFLLSETIGMSFTFVLKNFLLQKFSFVQVD